MPDILLVAFGSPKQEKWISRNRARLTVPVCIGIGGTLDFMAGTVRRAPMWMQRSGLEWVFRMYVDPKRLGPRYFTDAVWMARYLFVQLVVQRAFQYRQQELKVNLEPNDSVTVIGVAGAMTGSGLSTLDNALAVALMSGRPIVLDLAQTSHLGADGMWTLAGLLRRASQHSCDVWLAGMSRELERQLRAAHFEGLLQSAPSASEAVKEISRGRQRVNLGLAESWEAQRNRVAGAV